MQHCIGLSLYSVKTIRLCTIIRHGYSRLAGKEDGMIFAEDN
jgi:hypothetical protein